MSLEATHRKLAEGVSTGPAAAVARAALRAGVPLWRMGTWWDQRRKLARRSGLGRRTVSIGNLSAGGTGKTPAVIWACRRLLDAGHRPAVLTRGHGGRPGAEADEVVELREALGSAVPVHAEPDRHAGAAAVLAADAEIDCFVLDDGFQRRDVERGLDVVLFDASRPLFAARLLPLGLLREPPSALARADAVVLTRVERAGPAAADAAAAFIRRWHGRDPLARFAHRWASVDAHPGGEKPVSSLAGTRVHAAAGVGNPQAFTRQLVEAGAEVVSSSALADHHRPTAAGLAALHAAARSAGAEAIATTQKDWVKWRGLDAGPEALPVWVPRLSFKAVSSVDALATLLIERMGPGAADRGSER